MPSPPAERAAAATGSAAAGRRAADRREPGRTAGATGATGAAAATLPPVWRGPRRALLSLLVLTGLAEALTAGAGAHLLRHVLRSGGQTHQALLFWLLVGAALVVGLLKTAERILTERLSQHYVHELRLGLVRRTLTTGLGNSLGVAVARTTNDLTSVKNWVSMGIAPLAAGIPMVLGTTVVLALLSPPLVIAVLVPVALLVLALRVLTPPTYERSRELRRARGRLSGHLADTIMAADSIRSGGGATRELNRVERLSERLVDAAIARARCAGALRGAAATTVGLITALIIGVGVLAALPPATIAAALTVIGFLATPIHDLGRVAEYRQAYRAARRIIGPAVEQPADVAPAASRSATAPATVLDVPADGVLAENLLSTHGRILPPLSAAPGERIAVRLEDRASTSEALRRLAGLGLDARLPGQVLVDGVDLATAPARQLRSLVGYAAQGMLLGRGSISRTVSYRVPNGDEAAAEALLERVGLDARLQALPRGAATVLRHGGQPLTIPERARLLLARALFGSPSLLVLDHLDDDLGTGGRAVLREVLRDYPGVVVLASDQPDVLVDVSAWWTARHLHAVAGRAAEAEFRVI